MTQTDPSGNKPTRIILGVRGMNKEAGERIAALLRDCPGVVQAVPDQGQIAVSYDPGQLTVMDLVRLVRNQGFLAGMI